MKLSIIVPVYNVEKYIRACFESIFKQGLDDADYELIVIDDGSTDRSMEIIADFLSQHQNITILHQRNQGLSVVRNNGIAVAKGEYIFMPDSDDLLVSHSLPYLLELALSSKADLVVADFLEMSNEEVDNLQMNAIRQKDGTVTEKTGEQLFMEDLSPYQCYVWRTLFRRQFLLDIKAAFVPGIFFQDVPFTHECYLKAGKCLRVNWLLNVYRRRMGSATFTFTTTKSRDFSTTLGNTWELTYLKGLSSQVRNKLEKNVFTLTSVMLWRVSHVAKDAAGREQVIDFLKEKMPHLNMHFSMKGRLFSWMYNHWPHTLVHCRYLYDIIIEDRILPFYRHKIKSLFK